SGVLGCSSLGVIKIGRHRNDGAFHLVPQESFCVGFQLLEDHRRDLLGRVPFAVNRHPVIGPHVPLDRGDGAVRVQDSLSLGGSANQSLSTFGETHDGGGEIASFCVRDHPCLTAFHHGNHGVCRPEIN